MSNSLTLGGVDSLSYGIILTKPPPRIIPERDVESIAVAGRSGNLTIDKGRYKNVTLPLRCAILPLEGQTLRQAVNAAMPFLRPSAAYSRFKTSYDESFFMQARICKEVSIESIVEQAGEFTLYLDCKPQRYLLSGEQPSVVMSGEFFPNPTLEKASPLLHVRGKISGLVKIGDLSVTILFNSHTVTDEIWIDCDSQESWREADGVVTNANGSLATADFPKIAPGGSVITYTDVNAGGGGIEIVEVIPRWWTV